MLSIAIESNRIVIYVRMIKKIDSIDNGQSCRMERTPCARWPTILLSCHARRKRLGEATSLKGFGM